MDDSQSIFWTYREVRKHLRRSRPQVDRYRDPEYCAQYGLPPFPEPIRPGGRNHKGRTLGAMLFLKHEIEDYVVSLRQRLGTPADASE
jgi:hypothetical protein